MLTSMRRRAVPLVTAAVLAVPVAVALPASSAFAATCAQSTHIWIATPAGSLGNGNTLTLEPGTQVYPVGVVEPGSDIVFQATNIANGQSDAPYTTGYANGNCVVNQPSQSNAPIIGGGPGTWKVMGYYTPWETGVPTSTVVGYINIP